jgi:hypothetical protein
MAASPFSICLRSGRHLQSSSCRALFLATVDPLVFAQACDPPLKEGIVFGMVRMALHPASSCLQLVRQPSNCFTLVQRAHERRLDFGDLISICVEIGTRQHLGAEELPVTGKPMADSAIGPITRQTFSSASQRR